MKRHAFVLLSGGIDSTTCLHKAIVDFAPPGYLPNEISQRLITDRFNPIYAERVSRPCDKSLTYFVR